MGYKWKQCVQLLGSVLQGCPFSFPFPILFFKIYFVIRGKLLCNVVLVSVIQQCASTIINCIFPPSLASLPSPSFPFLILDGLNEDAKPGTKGVTLNGEVDSVCRG